MKFFGSVDTSNRHSLFGHCKFSGGYWSEWSQITKGGRVLGHAYDDGAEIFCDLKNGNQLESVEYKVCDHGADPGSDSEFFALFKNGDGIGCEMPLKDEPHKRNEFVKVTNTSTCKGIKFTPSMELWIVNAKNATSSNGLCLTHFYFDTFHRKRNGKFLKNIFHNTTEFLNKSTQQRY